MPKKPTKAQIRKKIRKTYRQPEMPPERCGNCKYLGCGWEGERWCEHPSFKMTDEDWNFNDFDEINTTIGVCDLWEGEE